MVHFIISVSMGISLLLSAVSMGCDKDEDGDHKVAHSYELTFVDKRTPDRPFRLVLGPEHKEAIASLDDKIKDGIIEQKSGHWSTAIPVGKIEKTDPSVDHAWSFKYVESTVRFNDMAIELCDGNMNYVEKNLDDWINDVGMWCPWAAGYTITKLEKKWTRKTTCDTPKS